MRDESGLLLCSSSLLLVLPDVGLRRRRERRSVRHETTSSTTHTSALDIIDFVGFFSPVEMRKLSQGGIISAMTWSMLDFDARCL